MERRIEKVKSLWKKYTSLFLLVTLLFTSLPIQVKAEESENPLNSEVSEEIEKQTNQEDTLIENSDFGLRDTQNLCSILIEEVNNTKVKLNNFEKSLS